jgi:electron transport complex protein RnfG
MVLSLLGITLVASLAVGVIYRVTAGPIADAKTAKLTNAIAQVLPPFDNTPGDSVQTLNIDGGEVKIYSGTKNGQPVGYAIESFSNNGFSGEVRLIVGFNPDGTIYRTEVLSQHETPGLGDKMERSKSDFAKQFDGKNPADFHLAVSKDGGDVDAITAATISSRAYTEAIARAYNVFCQITNHNTVVEEGKYE